MNNPIRLGFAQPRQPVRRPTVGQHSEEILREGRLWRSGDCRVEGVQDGRRVTLPVIDRNRGGREARNLQARFSEIRRQGGSSHLRFSPRGAVPSAGEE